MRSTRPETGADTTNRSRTRVTPSSSIVTTSGPRVTLPTSTAMVFGQRATARSTPTPARMSRTRRLKRSRSIVLFASLEHTNQIESIETPPDREGRQRSGGNHGQKSPRHGRRRDMKRQTVDLVVEPGKRQEAET